MTSSVRTDVDRYRLTIRPSRSNALERVSQVMIDKIATVPREKIRETGGRVTPEELARVTGTLAVLLGYVP